MVKEISDIILFLGSLDELNSMGRGNFKIADVEPITVGGDSVDRLKKLM